MGKLDKYIGSTPGYFRREAEDEFPWNATDRAVWYTLLVVEGGRIERYGFTPSKSSKDNLCLALKALEPDDEALLLGVWTGKYKTDLFILNIEKAVLKLSSIL